MALNVTGTNLFSYVPPDGGTIKKAADYLLNWAKNPSGQVLSEKGYNLFEGLLDIYKEPAYESWVASQRPCERTGHHKAWVYPTLMKWDPFNVSTGAKGISAPAVRSFDLHRTAQRTVVWSSDLHGRPASTMYDIRGKLFPDRQPITMPAGVFFVK
jgi:hypothetical protein